MVVRQRQLYVPFSIDCDMCVLEVVVLVRDGIVKTSKPADTKG